MRPVWIIICLLLACCCFTHRRVIKALIDHEPMPKAPKWHVWVKPENRRKSDKRKPKAPGHPGAFDFSGRRP